MFLVEFKSRATAWRMAAYIRERQANRTVSVLIDIFKGHSGKSGKIPQSTIKALEEKARVAKALVKKELNDGNL